MTALDEELKNNLDNLKAEAKTFFDANVDYYTLLGFKIATKTTGFILKIFALSLFAVLSLFFLSLAAAFAIGNALQSTTYGFLIVGTFYIVISIILYNVRKNLIDIPILKKFSKIFFD